MMKTVREDGRASTPCEPQGRDAAVEPAARSESSPHHALPVRRKLPHGPPPFPVAGPVVQFVTINAEKRGGRPFLDAAGPMLDAARFYHERGRCFLRLFLLMPDHLHMLVSVPEGGSVRAVCGAWKRYVAGHFGVRFQADCFEHRMRNGEELSETWWYIRNNPVRKGLVGDADGWVFWIGYDPRTGRALR